MCWWQRRNRNVSHKAILAWIAAYELNSLFSEHIHPHVTAMRNRAGELGFGVEVIPLYPNTPSPQKLQHKLRSLGVTGVVVSPLKEPGLSLPLPWDDYPYATIGRSLTHPVIHYTMSHFQHGTERVLEELIHRGYRRIGYVEDTYMDQRQDHTAVMVIEHYLRTIPKKNRMDPVIFEGVKFDHLRHWLTTKRPDVVISGSTRIYEMIRDTGVRIPEELGFTTLSWKKQYPECCGIRQRSADLASGAVDLVVAQIHRNERGIPPHAKAMLLEGDWVEGRTLRQ